MDVKELPARPSLEQYRKLARELLRAAQAGDAAGVRRIQTCPRVARSEVFAPVLADAQFVVAREHGFESWARFAAHLAGLSVGPVSRFEAAVDAVIDGDIDRLRALLLDDPALVQARAGRVHGATLLHYISANGVEDFRQKTPANVIEVGRVLLAAGADPDAAMPGRQGTPLGLVATSVHPARAGVQRALLDLLIDAGASVDGEPGGWSPVGAALHNGRPDAAEHLMERGATLHLESASGLGRLDVVQGLVGADGQAGTAPSPAELEASLGLAAVYGHVEVVAALLRHGATGTADARRRPTPLHDAAYGGHDAVIGVLIEHGLPVDATESSFGGTPLGWALYGWVHPPERNGDRYYEVVALLVAAGATVEDSWLTSPVRPEVGRRLASDPRMQAAFAGAAGSTP